MCIRDSFCTVSGMEGLERGIESARGDGCSVCAAAPETADAGTGKGCGLGAVSYTHLDVYKRQGKRGAWQVRRARHQGMRGEKRPVRGDALIQV